MNTRVIELSYAVRGFMDIHALSLRPVKHGYDLCIDLSNGETKISVTFFDISNLRLSDFGGGLVQLLYLEIRDVSAEQHDLVRFEVEELERGSFYLRCRDIEVTEYQGSHGVSGLKR